MNGSLASRMTAASSALIACDNADTVGEVGTPECVVHSTSAETAGKATIRSAFVALLVAGCVSGDAPSIADTGPEIDEIGAASVHEIGTSEEIGHIADIVEAADGTIWILNTSEPYLIAMAPDGSVSGSWGTRGGGPSEFRNPSTLVVEGRTGHVWVYDGGHHALMRVDGPVDPVETILIPRDSIPPGRIASTENAGTGEGGRAWIRGTESGFLLAVGGEGSTAFTRLWNVDIRLMTVEGAFRDAYTVGNRLGDPASRFGEEATEFLPYPLWAVCPDGTVVFYDPLGNTLHRLSPDDVLVDSISLPPERGLEVNLDRVFRMAYGFMREQAPGGLVLDSTAVYNQLKLMWDQIRTEAAAVFPEYADLQCTSAGTVWVQPFDPDSGMMGRGPVWIRIDGDGPPEWYRFPEAFRPLRFTADRVLGSLKGEFDVESVAWLSLPAH